MNRAAGTPSITDRRLTRREALRLAAAGAALLAGCGSESPLPSWLSKLKGRERRTSARPPCIVRPEQTEGPYFVDDRLNRSDIRTDPSDGTVKDGAPLELAIRVHEIRDKDCAPFPGAMVDVWHCDAFGVYSDVRDRSFDTRGKKFLRGYQMTDSDGTARFLSIYPGWYSDRTVHVHFKIRTSPESQRGFGFTSQIYFDDALTGRIHSRAPYAAKGAGRIMNREDLIFLDGGEDLILPLTRKADGYAGTFEIGLVMG